MKNDSPLNLPGIFGGLGLGIIAFQNRKEYGGGLKGLVGAAKGQMTGEHGDNKLDQINSKLDTLMGSDNQAPNSSVVGGGSLGTTYENAPAPAPPEEELPESPMTMKGPLFFNEGFRKLPVGVQKDIINNSKNK